VTVTVRELAEWVSGEVIGDGHLGITSARPLRDAQNGDLSFLEDEKYLSLAESSHAAALVVGPKTTLPTKTLIRVADPLMAFVHVFAQLHGIAEPEPTGIDSLARLHPSVEVGEAVFIDAHVSVGAGSTIGKGTRIHAGVVIGRNCHIAEDVILYPNVAIYDGTLIGNRVIIHANAVIGADGFGYRTQKGRHVKVPQLGHVEIADDVEIGHHSAALCHLGNIVCRTGRTVRIDTKTETIIDDVESGALVKRKYREGHWAVPAKV